MDFDALHFVLGLATLLVAVFAIWQKMHFRRGDQYDARLTALSDSMESNFAKVIGKIEELQANDVKMQAAIGGLQTDVAQLKTDVAQLKTDVAQLKTDVAGLKTDVAQLKTDVAQLKTDVAQLKTDVKALQGQVDRISEDLTAVKKALGKLDARQEAMEQRGTRTGNWLRELVDALRNERLREVLARFPQQGIAAQAVPEDSGGD